MNYASDKFNFLNQLSLDQDVIDRVSLNLMNIYSGRNDVYVTPLGKDHNPSLILEDFNKVFDKGRYKLNQTLTELEESNKAKFGPRSIAIPWSERQSSLTDSFKISENFNPTLVSLSKLPSGNRLRPVTKDKALNLLKNSTNSGLPYYTRKGIIKHKLLDKYESLLARKDPCILFTRTQESNKTRNVWGFPVIDTLNEMMYYSPLLSFQKKMDYRSVLLEPKQVDRQITKLINRALSENKQIISIDFTAYDTTVKSQLQKISFDYIRSLFQNKYHDDLFYIEERFNTIGIVTPSGVLNGSHGIPSGSTFTNEVGSINQAILITSLPYINLDDIQVQGDDGVYLVPKDKSEDVFNHLESFGLAVNKDKSYVSDNYTIFLQNLYHKDYEKDGVISGIYPVYRALNRILYQERWSNFEDFGIDGKDYYSIRTLCILENCKNHPLFEELTKFILKLDKYSLDVTDQGIVNYVKMINETEGAGEFIKQQYGDDVKGIKSFESFKLVNKLS